MSLMLLEKAKDKFVWPTPVKWFKASEYGIEGADKPVCDFAPENGISVADMPPLVTVEDAPTGLYDRWVNAANAVIDEAGDEHVCSPILRCSLSGMTMGFAYVYNGEGSCIVGKVLIKMGVEPSRIAAYEGQGADYLIRQFYAGDPQVSEVGHLASEMQSVNDSQRPWGYARPSRVLAA